MELEEKTRLVGRLGPKQSLDRLCFGLVRVQHLKQLLN